MLLNELMEMSKQSFATVKMIFKSNFARRGLNISFPTHANDRATEDTDRGASVENEHVMTALNKILRLYDNNDPQFMGLLEAVKRTGRTIEVVFKYFYDDTAVNLPCAVEVDRPNRGRFKIVMKTIMVKPDFKPHSTRDIVIKL